MKKIESDVVVIGGGPAGSATATWLAREGISVSVLEGKRFPRHHIGESLLSMSMPYLRALGMDAMLDRRGALRKYGSLFRWGYHDRPLILGQMSPGFAFQVKRAEFDHLLLDGARRAGACVHTEHWVRRLVWREGRLAGVAGYGPDGAFEASGRVVVDASGLPQLLPRRLRLPLGVHGPRRMALSGYFLDALRPLQHHENDIVTEATDGGWLWFIPLDATLTSVGFVTDAAQLDDTPENVLAREIGSSTIIKGLLEPARPDGHTRTLRYTNHVVESPFWRYGYVLVGDTAAFIDPLFSTGVHGALHSGSLAAAALASYLDGSVAEERAAAWYDGRAREHFVRVSTLVDLLYRVNPGTSGFWRARHQMQMDPDIAEDTVRRLGATGVAFFAQTQRNGTLALPDEISRRVPSFSCASQVRAVGPHTHVRLAPQVTIGADLTRAAGRLKPGLVLTHTANRLPRAEWPRDSGYARLVGHIDGKRPVRELARLAGVREGGATGAGAFLGTLAGAGYLVAQEATGHSTGES